MAADHEYKRCEMVVTSNKYHVQEWSKSTYETKMTMIVRKFQKDDVGAYRCIAKNSLGEVDSSIRLYEIPGPQRKSPSGKSMSTDADANDILKFKQGKVTYQPDDENDSSDDFDDNDSDNLPPLSPHQSNSHPYRSSTINPHSNEGRHHYQHINVDANGAVVFDGNKINVVAGSDTSGSNSYTRKPPFHGRTEIRGAIDNNEFTSTCRSIFLGLQFQLKTALLTTIFFILYL